MKSDLPIDAGLIVADFVAADAEGNPVDRWLDRTGRWELISGELRKTRDSFDAWMARIEKPKGAP